MARGPSRQTSRPLAAQRRAAMATAIGCLLIAGYLALHASDQGKVRTASELAIEGRYVESRDEVRGVSRSPAAGRAVVLRAQASQALGRHRTAIRLFRDALDREPRSWYLHRDLAISLLALGRREDAGRQLRLAAALNPRLVPPPGF